MKLPPQKISTASRILCALLLVVAPFLANLFPDRDAHAAGLGARSLTLEANGTTGGSLPGGTVKHHVTFSLPSTQTLGSLKLEYCDTAAPSAAFPNCTRPAGIDTSGATLANVSGTGANFNASTTSIQTDPVNTSSNNGLVLVRTGGASSVTGPVTIDFRLTGVVNPTTTNKTFFVWIKSYATTNASGSLTDQGTVVASTANAIILTGTMPESLVFCTGQTISLTSSAVDCSTATSGNIVFDKLFSPTDTAIAVSQMAASTNAGSGYAITVNGATLTSGSNTITPMATGSSVKNLSQFGMNLMANTSAASSSFPGTVSPYISADVSSASNGTNLRAQPKPGYNTADSFTYVDGAPVADSGQSNASPVATDAQIYTASYIVNVSGSQPAGTYSTTLTYICTATF